MAKKIVHILNLTGNPEINFTSYLGAIKAHILTKGLREQLKICFNLFDHDGDGTICPDDMNVFNTQYTGTCGLLSTDFIALANMYSFKTKYYP